MKHGRSSDGSIMIQTTAPNLESDKLGIAMDDILPHAVDVSAKDASETAVHVEMRGA
jgi:hypothetical protein